MGEMDRVILPAAMLVNGPWSCRETPRPPETRQVLVAHDAQRPEARWIVPQRTTGQALFVPATQAAQGGLPSPWHAVIDAEAGRVVVDAQGSRDIELVIDEVHPPVPASDEEVAQMERVVSAVGGLVTWDDHPPVRTVFEAQGGCSYTGDHVQTLLDAGVALEDLVPVLVRQWTYYDRALRVGNLTPALVLRSSDTHRVAIRALLEDMAQDDTLDLDRRMMALNAWWVARPSLADRSERFDPGHPLEVEAVSKVGRCDRAYEASAPWAPDGSDGLPDGPATR